MSEKIVGYLLLVAGLVIIVIAVISVYSVFTKKSNPVDLFNLGGISIDMSSFAGADLSSEQREQLARSNLSTKTELIPSSVLSTPLNYAAHLMFMGFLASIGFKIANIGTMLIRPIKVKLKSQDTVTASTK